MKRRRAAELCSFSLALAAWAAPAGALPFSATLAIAVGSLGTLPFQGAGSGASTVGQVTLPGGTFMGTATPRGGGGPAAHGHRREDRRQRLGRLRGKPSHRRCRFLARRR